MAFGLNSEILDFIVQFMHIGTSKEGPRIRHLTLLVYCDHH